MGLPSTVLVFPTRVPTPSEAPAPGASTYLMGTTLLPQDPLSPFGLQIGRNPFLWANRRIVTLDQLIDQDQEFSSFLD